MELFDKNLLIERLKDKFITKLEDEKLYSILIHIDYIKNGEVSGISPIKSMIVTGNTNVKLLSVNILNGLNKVNDEYRLITEECMVSVH